MQYPQHQEVRVGLWQMMAGDFDFPGVEVRLALTVPRALPVTLRSTSGDLFTEDIEGAFFGLPNSPVENNLYHFRLAVGKTHLAGGLRP